MMNSSIYPCLWYNQKAQEAAIFYHHIFKNSKITSENNLVSLLEINGEKLMLLNGGPEFMANPSVSLYVSCSSESEIDEIWYKFSEEGSVLMDLNKYDW